MKIDLKIMISQTSEEFNKMCFQKFTLNNIQQTGEETTNLLNLWITRPFSPQVTKKSF